MTAQQLRHLAEQAATAHDFYRRTNPPAARLFGDVAHVAVRLADRLGHEEQHASLSLDLQALHDDLGPDVA